MVFFLDENHKEQRFFENSHDDKFKILFDNAPDAIYLFDSYGKFVDGNGAAERICGYRKDELIGKNFSDSNILPKNQISIALKIFAKNKLGIPTGPDELTLINKNGSRIPIEIRTFPVTIENKQLTLGIARDISDRKKAEEEKRLIEQEMINTIRRLPAHVFRIKKNEKGNYIFMMSEGDIASQFDITTKQVKGLKLKDISSPENYYIIKKYYDKVFSNQSVSFELKLRDKYWFQTNLIPYTIDKTGEVQDIIGYSIDITDRKDAIDKMKQSEERLNLAMSIANDGVWDWDLISNEVFFDSRYYTMAGYEPREFPCRLEEFQKRVHPDHIDQVMEQAQKHLVGEKDFFQVEFPFKRKNGEWMWIQGTGKIVEQDDSGKPVRFIGTHSDITKRKMAEEQAKKAQKDRELLFNASSNGIRIITKDFKVKMMNHTMANIAHTSIEDGLGMKCSEMFGSKWCGTEQCSMRRVLQNGQGFIDEDVRSNKDGKEIYFIDSVTPYLDDHGNIIGIIEDFRDITPIKEAEQELEKNHQALIKVNEDLEEIIIERTIEVEKLLIQKDEFVNQLGHDLKNPLGPLVTLLPVLEKKENDPEKKEMISVMLRNVGYMKNLVTKTIELARLNSPNTEFKFQELNLSDLVNGVIDNNKLFFQKEKIKIINNIPEDIVLHGDLLRLQELFNNLFDNSVKYTKGEGEILISAGRDSEMITISVNDKGIGLSKDQIDHIFDEFFKADESRHHFESSGLGMTICKRIVELHGGDIWAESEGLNKGTTVSFTLKIGHTDTRDPEITDEKNRTQPERVKKIFHQGREILYFDFSNFTDDDYESFSQEITRTIADYRQKDLLVMTNVLNNSFSIESVRKTRNIGKIIQPYIKKSAIVGITKHQEMFLKVAKIISGIEINTFKSVEDARDWLVKE